MDLSAVIFVVLALAWAVYLIPKALKHHDEMASDRLVQGHSDKVRILSRKAKGGAAEVAEAVTPAAQAELRVASDPGYPARKPAMLEADPVAAPRDPRRRPQGRPAPSPRARACSSSPSPSCGP